MRPQVSRLLELIALTNRTIQLHKEHGTTQEQISDYNSLLAEHNSELNDYAHLWTDHQGPAS